MGFDNELNIAFSAKSENESLARVCVSAFLAPLDPTITELTDVKTAVSEAVTNAIIHGYEGTTGMVELWCGLSGRTVHIRVKDFGCGILNIDEAKQPLYTSKPEQERSGMGFTVMETFMDMVEVISEQDAGTTVVMSKELA